MINKIILLLCMIFLIIVPFSLAIPSVPLNLGAEDITENSAILRGEIKDLGNETVNVSFKYRKINEDWIQTTPEIKNSIGKFEYRIDNLSLNTIYEFKPVVEYNESERNGVIKEFQTESKESIFTVDLSETKNLIIMILLFVFAVVLFFLNFVSFSSLIIIINGFIMLGSGINIIISFIIISVGILIAFLNTGDKQ